MEPWYTDQSAKLYLGDSLAVLQTLPSCSVQCCVTSPPYWGLRDYGVDGQLGHEPTPEEFVNKLVAIFREVRRVLRDDGVLFVNMGDSYSLTGKWGGCSSNKNDPDQGYTRHKRHSGLKPKDLIGVPWLLAFALRADGWFLRSEIIWSKKSPMPESVRDRPTKAHEQIFLLSKSERYYWDLVGAQEQSVSQRPSGNKSLKYGNGEVQHRTKENLGTWDGGASRNMRSVWSLASYPLKSKHFAAYPPELVRRCLSGGVSPNGRCSKCGTPSNRIVEKKRVPTRSGATSKVNAVVLDPNSPYQDQAGVICGNRDPKRHCTQTVTVGWEPGCMCENAVMVPCVVLDPFNGAGTTWKVCRRLGLHYIGMDINAEYLQLSVDRPEVHFPHERRKPKPRRIRKHVTPLLEGME